MKKTLLIVAILTFNCILFAQDGSRIEQAKIAFLTTKINLTSAEAEKFWPVYNEYKSKMKALRKDRKMDLLDISDPSSLSEKDAENSLNEIIIAEQKMLDLRKEVLYKFKSFLSNKKILMFIKAEKDFNKEVLKQLKERRDAR